MDCTLDSLSGAPMVIALPRDAIVEEPTKNVTIGTHVIYACNIPVLLFYRE